MKGSEFLESLNNTYCHVSIIIKAFKEHNISGIIPHQHYVTKPIQCHEEILVNQVTFRVVKD